MALPTAAAERKNIPIVTGFCDYFPDAIAAVAELSRVANEQHNPGQPLHWAREKSTDHADCIGRHLLERGTIDTDGQRHSAKLAWRALALLQTEIETTRAPATKWGFTVGDRIRVRDHKWLVGTVVDFDELYVRVDIDCRDKREGWCPGSIEKLT